MCECCYHILNMTAVHCYSAISCMFIISNATGKDGNKSGQENAIVSFFSEVNKQMCNNRIDRNNYYFKRQL